MLHTPADVDATAALYSKSATPQYCKPVQNFSRSGQKKLFIKVLPESILDLMDPVPEFTEHM